MRVLITGVSGLLGLNMALIARERAQVTGCYRRHPVRIEGVDAFAADLTQPGMLDALFDRVQPEIVVHTVGLTSVDGCEADPALARQLNVDVAADVARRAARPGVRLVHLSSDHVFAGTSAWHEEGEALQPLNVYAQTKADAERAVFAHCPDALVIRTNFFGWGPPQRPSFSDWILAALRRGDELRMFTDVFFTPMLINDLAEVLFELVARGVSGIYHVAGAERLSKFEFAKRLAAAFGLSDANIRSAVLETAGLRAARPKDMSLRTDKVARLVARPMPPVAEGMVRLRHLEEAGWPHSMARAIAAAAT